MRVYDESDYKQVIKKRVAELKKDGSGLSLRKVAQHVPMQYTFLSRVLNRDDAHLSEDQIYAIAELLEFYPDETEFLFLLRAIATTANEKRRRKLIARAESERQRHTMSAALQDGTRSEFNLGMNYLLDPTNLFVHLALEIPHYRKNPKSLTHALGISLQKLSATLQVLHKLGHLELGDDPFTVRRMNQSHMHFGADHPLTRVHQSLLKTLAAAHLLRAPEEDKKSMQALFAADPHSFEAIKNEFDLFVRKAEKIATGAPSRAIYQMSFDIFRWLS